MKVTNCAIQTYHLIFTNFLIDWKLLRQSRIQWLKSPSFLWYKSKSVKPRFCGLDLLCTRQQKLDWHIETQTHCKILYINNIVEQCHRAAYEKQESFRSTLQQDHSLLAKTLLVTEELKNKKSFRQKLLRWNIVNSFIMKLEKMNNHEAEMFSTYFSHATRF